MTVTSFLSRRGLLKALPVVPFAVKSAAKALSPEELTGTRLLGSKGWSRVHDFDPESPEEAAEEAERVGKLLDWVLRNGIPEWKRRQFRRRARDTRMLDPDIAVLQSVSFGHKLRMQWDREEKHMLDQEMKYLRGGDGKAEWLKKLGIRYW
jgi:hypothetical protein